MAKLLAAPRAGNLAQSGDPCRPETGLSFPLGPCCPPFPTPFFQPLATSLQPKAKAWQTQPPELSEWMVGFSAPPLPLCRETTSACLPGLRLCAVWPPSWELDCRLRTGRISRVRSLVQGHTGSRNSLTTKFCVFTLGSEELAGEAGPFALTSGADPATPPWQTHGR